MPKSVHVVHNSNVYSCSMVNDSILPFEFNFLMLDILVKHIYVYYLFAARTQDTIYEIYKRNIAQIVIKNVRRTRAKESKQKKQKQE